VTGFSGTTSVDFGSYSSKLISCAVNGTVRNVAVARVAKAERREDMVLIRVGLG
jgi:hypothetical protein